MNPLSFKQIAKLILMCLLSGVFFAVGIPFLNAFCLFWTPEHIYSNDAFLAPGIVAGQSWWLTMLMGAAYFLMTVRKDEESPYKGRFPWARNVFISLSSVYCCMVLQLILQQYYPDAPVFLYSWWLALVPTLAWQGTLLYQGRHNIMANLIRACQQG